jgi:hypothetical protein
MTFYTKNTKVNYSSVGENSSHLVTLVMAKMWDLLYVILSSNVTAGLPQTQILKLTVCWLGRELIG